MSSSAIVVDLQSDPTTGSGSYANVGTVGLLAGTARVFVKTGGLATQWTEVGSAGAGSFVWKVGVTWAAIYAAMSAVAGPKRLLVEWDAAPRSMTNNSGVPHDLGNVLFTGIGGNGELDECPIIEVQDGFKLASSRNNGGETAVLASKDVSWDFSALTAPIYTTPNPVADRAMFSFDGGRLEGTQTGGLPGVVRGTLWLELSRIRYVGGYMGKGLAGASSVLYMTRMTTLNAEVFLDSGGSGAIDVTCDGTCRWQPNLWTTPPTVTLHNYVLGTDGQLYQLDAGGGPPLVARVTPV